MRPRKDDDTFVDVLDVLLRDGAVVRADVIVSVAEIPLVGIKLTAAIAGMETMNEYGLFEEWDARRRARATGSAEDVEAEDTLEDLADLDELTVDRREAQSEVEADADVDGSEPNTEPSSE